MSHVAVHQGGQDTAAERSPSSARAQHGAVRGGAESVARVRFVPAPSLSISRASRQTWPSSASRGSLDSYYPEASTAYRARVARLCCPQRSDARGDRHTCAGSVSERSSKAWLSDVQDVSPFKFISTIRLIAYAGRSSRRCMSSWCPRSSASSAHVSGRASMKLAVIYARVSSDQQREEHTIASQTAALIEFAKNHELEVPKEWIFEDEGYSGATLERPGLERVRDLAAEGQVQVVLAYAPDRLSRKYAYQILLIEELARHGVETRFVKAPQGATAEDQLLVQFQGMIAEYERAQILERSR